MLYVKQMLDYNYLSLRENVDDVLIGTHEKQDQIKENQFQNNDMQAQINEMQPQRRTFKKLCLALLVAAMILFIPPG